MAFKYGMLRYIITFSMYVKPDIVVAVRIVCDL